MPINAIIVMEENIGDIKCLTFCKQRERERRDKAMEAGSYYD